MSKAFHPNASRQQIILYIFNLDLYGKIGTFGILSNNIRTTILVGKKQLEVPLMHYTHFLTPNKQNSTSLNI